MSNRTSEDQWLPTWPDMTCMTFLMIDLRLGRCPSHSGAAREGLIWPLHSLCPCRRPCITSWQSDNEEERDAATGIGENFVELDHHGSPWWNFIKVRALVSCLKLSSCLYAKLICDSLNRGPREMMLFQKTVVQDSEALSVISYTHRAGVAGMWCLSNFKHLLNWVLCPPACVPQGRVQKPGMSHQSEIKAGVQANIFAGLHEYCYY